MLKELSILTQSQQSPVVAIDLGSNSFHLLQATLDKDGRLNPVAALARKVQLALDMTDRGMTAEAIERGLDCLRDFAPYCQGLAANQIRVVGTQALRIAGNSSEFIDAATDILNHPVEIVSGEEEAELAYWGVASDCGLQGELMVVDIGGGSTELVTGSDGETRQLVSLQLGCVSWLQYFPENRLSAQLFEQAKHAARQIFDPVAHQFDGDWQVKGCSGTLLAVAEVLKRQGWSDGAITREGLELLRQALMSFDQIEAVNFQGLVEDRRSIFASGVAIVSALFESFALDSMALSCHGLREGVAWRLLHA